MLGRRIMGKSFSTSYPQQWVEIAILIGFCIVLDLYRRCFHKEIVS